MDFGDFLGQMSEQTGASLTLPDSTSIKNKYLKEEAPAKKPERQEKKAPEQPQQSEPTPEPSKSEDDAIERVYEATSAILKTIRKAFPDKSERLMAFESIRNALTMAMGESPVQARPMPAPAPTPQAPSVAETLFPSKKGIMPPASAYPTPTGNYIVPRQNMSMEGMEVELPKYDMAELNEDAANGGDINYSRFIDIKPGQGLAGVSAADIADLKALAGIGAKK